MKKTLPRILLYGYGNPGRQDDGLGVLLAGKIEKWAQKNRYLNLEVDQNYQLNIEDSEKISHYDVVIFADASINCTQPYSFTKLLPDLRNDFTMHSVHPSFVVGLNKEIFKNYPKTFLLSIRGYEWEIVDTISSEAKKNLEASVYFLQTLIKEKYLTGNV
jgi:hydrogenase maturation protease